VTISDSFWNTNSFFKIKLQNQNAEVACWYLDQAVSYNPRDPEILILRYGQNTPSSVNSVI
jgi:hypothetical protein